jgi:hypothetical protein
LLGIESPPAVEWFPTLASGEIVDSYRNGRPRSGLVGCNRCQPPFDFLLVVGVTDGLDSIEQVGQHSRGTVGCLAVVRGRRGSTDTCRRRGVFDTNQNVVYALARGPRDGKGVRDGECSAFECCRRDWWVGGH